MTNVRSVLDELVVFSGHKVFRGNLLLCINSNQFGYIRMFAVSQWQSLQQSNALMLLMRYVLQVHLAFTSEWLACDHFGHSKSDLCGLYIEFSIFRFLCNLVYGLNVI